MKYEFRCDGCDFDTEAEIALADYDMEKGKQPCPICGKRMERKYSVFVERPKPDGRGFYGGV